MNKLGKELSVFFTNQHQFAKFITNQHRPRVLDTSFSTGPGQTYQFETQPMHGLVTDMNPQVRAEWAFYLYQLQTGQEVFATGIQENAYHCTNRHQFEEAMQREAFFDEMAEMKEMEEMQQGYPDLEQPQKHDPMMPGPGVIPRVGTGVY
jgi:hypothetical protein